jgi:hypothetical protein
MSANRRALIVSAAKNEKGESGVNCGVNRPTGSWFVLLSVRGKSSKINWLGN